MLGIRRVMVVLSALLLLFSGVAAARTASPSANKKKSAARSSRPRSKAVKSSSRRSGKTRRASRRRRNWRSRGQQAIKDDRAREIQTALIREHYLSGEPSGEWDARTKQAMAKYQEDHGWQTKRLPDARALIELGLGPTHEGLLNPESVASTERPVTNPPTARPR